MNENTYPLMTTITKKPKTIVTNLTGDFLTSEEERILNYGFNHGQITRCCIS